MNRIEKLRKYMEAQEVEATLICSSQNVYYYTGFRCSESFVLITEKNVYVLTDFRYVIQAREEALNCEIIEITSSDLCKKLNAILPVGTRIKCGFEEDIISVQQFETFSALNADLVPFSDWIRKPRIIKDEEEIRCLQIAQNMADAAFAELLKRIIVGKTEIEIAAELDYLCRLQGSEGPSFDTIIGSGPNGAMCHAIPGNRAIQKGDLIVVDFGCIYKGYHSDMTRTIGIGKVNDKCREIYDIVYKSQLMCLEKVKDGLSGYEMDDIARSMISKAGFGENFGHSLGHGFGLEIHEPPRASTTSDDVLRAGMTITDEPGIYIENEFGVRIEDCLVVTENGCLNLPSTTKELIIV